MAWIEQTKKGSRKSGGPQYYLQGLGGNVATLLRAKRRCPIRLWTPYGIVETNLNAVSKCVGAVGHDRVQTQRRGVRQVAEQVAHWYKLKSADIERIEFADTLDKDAFVISPTRITFFRRKRPQRIDKDTHPLTVTTNHRSRLLTEHLKKSPRGCSVCRPWAAAQIAALVADHARAQGRVNERDLLRASGALHRLGVDLGVYKDRDIDCPKASFRFLGFPHYACPVEIEERSGGFLARHHREHRKQRVVVLCMEHDQPEVLQDYTDVIELKALNRLLREIP